MKYVSFKEFIKKNVIFDFGNNNKCFKNCKYLKNDRQEECMLFFKLLRIDDNGFLNRCEFCISIFGKSEHGVPMDL